MGLGPGDRLTVDHINGDPLDNRRENLRIATRQENQRNRRGWGRSGFKGVLFRAKRQRWEAYIQVGTRVFSRARHTAEEAAIAYDDMAREHFGQFARLNFPRPGEQAA